MHERKYVIMLHCYIVIMIMRKPIIIGNWKMNLTLEDARRLIVELRQGLIAVDERKIDIVVCPAFVHLQSVNFQLPVNIKLGAQDVFWKDRGAFTGEVSPVMLKDVGCKYIIVGHSERRKNVQETDEMINQEIRACLKHTLAPILCVGETKEEREKNLTDSVIKNQTTKDLDGIEPKNIEKVIIAYEPVWAISSGKTPQGKDADKIAKLIREVIKERYSKETADKVRVVYGGSVDPRNIKEFVDQPGIDGALVGEASLNANKFIKIVSQIM